jgi:hypothetical protein
MTDTEREDLLVKFLVWLGDQRYIPTQEMPSGKIVYGHRLTDPVELLTEFLRDQ